MRESSPKVLDMSDRRSEPDFDLTLERKFEQTEMCEIFYNRYVKWAYLIIMSVYGFQGSWAYATVAASAWATNIPFNTPTLQQCHQDDFNGYVPLTVECANTYRLCVFIFGVIVVILSLIDLTEQFIIQVTMGIMRFVTMVCMMIFCVVRVIESHGQPPIFSTNITSLTNVSVPDNSSNSSHSSHHLSFGEAFYHFDFRVWLIAIPIFVYSQLTHMGVVTLSGPMRPKKYMKQFFAFLMSSTFGIYSVLAISVAMYFQYKVNDTASLNWVSL